MDTLRGFTLSAIAQTIAFTRLVQYCILLPFNPLIELLIKRIFLSCDVKINGKRRWDVWVKDRRFYPTLIAYGPLGLSESYLKGWVGSQDIEQAFFKLLSHGLLIPWMLMPWNRLAIYLQFEWLNTQSRQRAVYSCNPNYNLGQDFFKHFLDDSMSYSVAYWKKGAQSLEEAQRHKMELVAQKLKLKPGMRVLDVGCGYGGLCKYLAENHGVKVVGITNSTAMGEEAEKRCKGLPVEIKLVDWRDLQGTFDRVVCIEMVFHVGKHNLAGFFKQVGKWLKDQDGILVMQDFSSAHDYFCSEEFYSKYVFPYAYTAHVDELIKKSAPYFVLEHYEDMTEDFVHTFHEFYKRFQKAWPEISLNYDKKLFKITEAYFLSLVVASRLRKFFTHQMVFTKIPEIK